MTEAKGPLRAALYLRLSKENDASTSLELQEEKLRLMCAANEWEVLEPPYRDEGVSGATVIRPELQRLLTDVKARKVDVVCIYRFDRLSRSLRDFLNVVEDLSRRKVALASYVERLDSSTPHGRFGVQMLVAAAELERAMIASRTSAALQYRKARMMPYAGTPFGLRRVGARLVPDERELRAVLDMQRLRAQGRSLSAIADALRSAGVATKTGRERWSKEQIRAVLARAEFYRPLLEGLQEKEGRG